MYNILGLEVDLEIRHFYIKKKINVPYYLAVQHLWQATKSCHQLSVQKLAIQVSYVIVLLFIF